jgi:hypothetical protein
VRKWINVGGIDGINTPGTDALQGLTDETDGEVCGALNATRLANHEQPKTVFRLGDFYLAVLALPLIANSEGVFRIDEGASIVTLWDRTNSTIGINHTRVKQGR